MSRLSEHYEAKYASEVGTGVEALTPHPRNRFQAAVCAMHRHFRGGDILEVGGGEGTVARSIIAAGVPFDRYVLADLSSTRSARAAAQMNDARVSAYAMDVENDTSAIADQRFDAILMIALIEHLIDPIRAMKTLRDTLKPSGFVYIDTPNIAKYTRRIKLCCGLFPATAAKDEGLTTYEGGPVDLYDEGHLHYWTYGSMSAMLRRYCGFSSVEPVGYWVGPKGPLSHGMATAVARRWPHLFADVCVIARP